MPNLLLGTYLIDQCLRRSRKTRPRASLYCVMYNSIRWVGIVWL